MPQQYIKKIGQRPNKPVSKLDTLRDTWMIMKPFVHFSIKAMRVIAKGLIFIVKNIPKPDHHEQKPKGKVIKI